MTVSYSSKLFWEEQRNYDVCSFEYSPRFEESNKSLWYCLQAPIVVGFGPFIELATIYNDVGILTYKREDMQVRH